MKRALILYFIVFAIPNSNAQSSTITADILRQTYLLNTDTLQGTCFLIEANGQEYLLTAKHLFRSKLRYGDSTMVTIYQENKPRSLNVKYYVHEDSTIDICLLKLKESIKVMTPFPIGGNMILGQDVYFLGYPNFDNIQFLTSGTIGILPLVKKCIVSGWVVNTRDQQKSLTVIV